MLELSKPFYNERIAANKEVSSAILNSFDQGLYFESAIDELHAIGHADVPGFINTFYSITSLFYTLVASPFSIVTDKLKEYSSYIHPNVQPYIDAYMMAYRSFYEQAKDFKNSKEIDFIPRNINEMMAAKMKILHEMQLLYKKIDILNG